ncbi:MAG: tetratricopeptide repeat protein [Bacteroidetes bacterium]|nr:tetratricopeptide repeat protein [Bacteroidota bacterium]
MQKYFKESLCLLLAMLCFGQLLMVAQVDPEIERSLKKLNRMRNSKKKVTALIDFSNQHYITHPDEALEAANEALTTSWEINYREGVTAAHHSLGAIYLDQLDYPQARENLIKFLEFGNQRPGSETIAMEEAARAYRDIGRTYMAENNIIEGVNYYEKSLSLHFKNLDTLGAANIIFLIGRAHLMNGDYEKAALEYGRALPLASGDQILHANILRAKENAENILEGYLQTEVFQEKTEELTQKYSVVLDSLSRTRREREKIESERNLLQAKNALAQAEIRRKNEEKRFISGLLIMILLLALAILYAFLLKRKSNRELAEKHRQLREEKKRSDELLLNILPAETANELKLTGKAEARSHEQVTVLFTDFLGFTTQAEKMTPHELVEELHYCFEAFDKIIGKYGIEKIKTIGDAYMCAGGLPVADQENAEKTVMAALELQAFLKNLKEERQISGQPFFEARLGIHTGPVVAGVVGIKKFSYDIWGDTVNTASRMESSGEVGKVNISRSTYLLVKDKFECTPRGKIMAKNKGEVDMYFVEGL